MKNKFKKFKKYEIESSKLSLLFGGGPGGQQSVPCGCVIAFFNIDTACQKES